MKDRDCLLVGETRALTFPRYAAVPIIAMSTAGGRSAPVWLGVTIHIPGFRVQRRDGRWPHPEALATAIPDVAGVNGTVSDLVRIRMG